MAESEGSEGVFSTDNPERALMTTYAPAARRTAFLSLLALDDVLAEVPRTTHEPALGQMRLVWWRDALIALDGAPAPAQPVLRAIEHSVLPPGISGAELGEIAEGWAVLVEAEALSLADMERYAQGRGAGLFVAAAKVLGGEADMPLAEAGKGWALADLSRNLSDRGDADRAATLARPLLNHALRRKWPVHLRALGAMAHLRRMDLAADWRKPIALGSPKRVARLGWHRISGR
ncbi:squalene/phytoene synthase family protein [Stakelama pacifica]|uniref:Phytoene synthase n=1 Tax=Stakelama pacifica TaxID=517720 RepID=A0A4R6FXE9_9SPHN|nr:squalene/phytoene synthase family protein [Stakelama pacifica]TDN86659.1 phytoene synthase [Stakelama pacifica]GGO90302.1 hypothetical protein GCM10011329_02290 [Stakelama pacifica]